MHTTTRILMSTLAVSLCTPITAHAQSAGDVLNRMVAEYERRVKNVDNYTLVQETMGMETAQYYEKEVVDGRSRFWLRQTRAGGMVVTQDEDDGGWDDIYASLPELVSNAEYAGREEIDGHPVHVVKVTDLQEIDFGPRSGPDGSDFRPDRGTMFVDTELWVVRRMQLEGHMTMEGEAHDVTSIIELRDYREIDGMLHPFHITVSMEGLGEAMGPKMRAQYEEMMKHLEQMPEAQRKMAEEMMKQQMPMLEQMLDQESGGGMTLEMTVKEVRVNSGAPAND